MMQWPRRVCTGGRDRLGCLGEDVHSSSRHATFFLESVMHRVDFSIWMMEDTPTLTRRRVGEMTQRLARRERGRRYMGPSGVRQSHNPTKTNNTQTQHQKHTKKQPKRHRRRLVHSTVRT